MSQENVEIVRRAYETFNRWGADPEAEPLAERHSYSTKADALAAVGLRE